MAPCFLIFFSFSFLFFCCRSQCIILPMVESVDLRLCRRINYVNGLRLWPWTCLAYCFLLNNLTSTSNVTINKKKCKCIVDRATLCCMFNSQRWQREKKKEWLKHFIVSLQGLLKVRDVSGTLMEVASWRTRCYAPPQLTCILSKGLACHPHGHFRTEILLHSNTTQLVIHNQKRTRKLTSPLRSVLSEAWQEC